MSHNPACTVVEAHSDEDCQPQPMRLFSVTVEWETDRGSQYVENVAVLALTEEGAVAHAKVGGALPAPLYPTEITATGNGPWLGFVSPVVVLSLREHGNQLAWEVRS